MFRDSQIWIGCTGNGISCVVWQRSKSECLKLELNKIVKSKNLQATMFDYVNRFIKMDGMRASRSRTSCCNNDTSTRRWQHSYPRILLHFCMTEGCSNMSSTFLSCKFSLDKRQWLFFFVVCTHCEQQSKPPHFLLGLTRNVSHWLVPNLNPFHRTSWPLLLHCGHQWHTVVCSDYLGGSSLAASCSWFSGGPVPKSVDLVHHQDTKAVRTRTKLSC